MAFVSAMSAPALTKSGVKGSDVYTEAGVGDLRVAFFTQLVRGLSSNQITDYVERILASGDQAQARDLVVMAFQTRDVRGGKGERDLGRHMLAALCQTRPAWAEDLIALVPEYGCWKDLWSLWSEVPSLQKKIDAVVHRQFLLDQETHKPSLLIKWLPREGSKYYQLARHFAALFFPLTPAENGQRMRTYRRCLATLNRHLDTTEIKMCAKEGQWSEIRPKNVPGRLMKRCKNAFFNQTNPKRGAPQTRYPDRQDRVECAEHFKEFMTKVATGEEKMKGGDTTMPHEHIHEIYHNRHMSSDALQVIQAQWDAIRALAEAGGGLGKLVPMCDFSGSMDGVPKEVSLALGILISEVASPAFRDCILTFDSDPRWFNFAAAGCKTLADKVRCCGSLGQGLSTDFQKAADLILQRLVEHKVPREEAPSDLLVLTDMGFDAACGQGAYNVRKKPWETHFQMIRRNFEEAGYDPPRIICWNLRAEYKDFHAKAGEVGVVQLSGWSPAVLKALQGEGIKVQTPYEGLRMLLDAPRYDRVREVVDILQGLKPRPDVE